MQKAKTYDSKDRLILIVAGALAVIIMVASYITALAQFNGPPAEETSDVSEESFESSTVEVESDTTSKDAHNYEYYDDFDFESYPYQNSAIRNGSLAIIRGGEEGFPTIDHSKIVNIGNVMTNRVYGLDNMSLVLYNEAITNIDSFLVSFFEQVPSNGLIIQSGYTAPEKISEATVDLASGYSVRFQILYTAYKFSDTEFSYLKDQAYRYGVIQRYPDGKDEYTGRSGDNTIYRYVGLAHSQYMNRYRYSLEEYLDKIRTEGVIEYKSELEADTAYVIYYVPADDELDTTYIELPQGDGYTYTVSGDGTDGFIVTVKVSI